MLIDYVVGAALAISGMLALLVFGTDIIRMNTEARENWQAKNALADFVGRRSINPIDELASGELCQGNGPAWVAFWCQSPQVQSLPNVCVHLNLESANIILRWGQEGCSGERALFAKRRL